MSRPVFERGLALLLRVVSRLLLAFLSLVQSFGSRDLRPVPPAVQPLLLLPGVELARRIRQRQVKCVDVIQEYINRIRVINPIVNAVVAERFASALKEAQKVDDRIAKGNEDEKLLEETVPYLGVPFTVKEAIALEGSPNSSGLVSRKNVIALTDAAVVTNLRKAGAIPLGVTNCSELCMWYESSNNVYGTTRNPYNVDRIVGGSSGLVPNDGQFPNATGLKAEFLCTGPMCRYADDLIPMFKVMAGPNISKVKLDEEVLIKKVKFYSMEHDGGSPFLSKVDKELIHAQRRLTEYLEVQFGVQVQQVQIRKMKYAFQIWSAMMTASEADGKEFKSFKDLMADGGKEIKPLWELMKKALGISPHTFPAIGLGIVEDLAKVDHSSNVKLMNMCHNLQAELSSLLGDDGVFLYPSHPKIAPRHHHPKLMPFNFAYTAIFNVLGLPVTQCPLGLSKDGLPLGIQLVANHHNDHLCLHVAQHLETAFGGWQNPGAS
ncbi:fatty-acid amide hydrolase 2 isoform X3 [Rhincodon typus]|uniref:fatty-acid amide hydrolase 2 isoform X3 n=1 Tax=Rhincodon typus TaxID=259920 RepID=UPI00203045E4|nr:fatty-acid amide hydrolase 2 isoform X3 [Rhincodon typus]